MHIFILIFAKRSSNSDTSCFAKLSRTYLGTSFSKNFNVPHIFLKHFKCYVRIRKKILKSPKFLEKRILGLHITLVSFFINFMARREYNILSISSTIYLILSTPMLLSCIHATPVYNTRYISDILLQKHWI